MLAQATVPETGCTETLDLDRWLEHCDERMPERDPDAAPGPVHSEDGSLHWPPGASTAPTMRRGLMRGSSCGSISAAPPAWTAWAAW